MGFLVPARAARTGDDPIFSLNAEAGARAAAGESIVNATVGMLLKDDGKLALIETVVDEIRRIPAEIGASYPPIAGTQAFRQAVIEDLFREGQRSREAAEHAVAIVTPGGSGALRHCIANFLEPQQTLLTTSLYWSPYRTVADELDRNLLTFRLLDDRGRFDADDFERKLTAVIEMQGRALIFLNSPCHNPTGYSLDADDWARLVDAIERGADRGPVALVLDIAYARYSATDLSETLEWILRLSGKVLLLFAWSASKSFTQYGLRVGSLVAVHPDPAARRSIEGALVFSSRGTWSCCNAVGMEAISRVLTVPELRARADAERAELFAMLGRRIASWNDLAAKAGLRHPRYSGGFFTTVFCDDGPALAARLRADGIFVVPLAGGVRVALSSVAERDIPRLVSGIAKHVG